MKNMEEKNKKAIITPKFAKIIENQLDRCLKEKKMPSKRLLDTIKVFKDFVKG